MEASLNLKSHRKETMTTPEESEQAECPAIAEMPPEKETEHSKK
jgi:hypothetical protein